MVYLDKVQLNGQKIRLPVLNIKDTRLLHKYVHIYLYKVVVAQGFCYPMFLSPKTWLLSITLNWIIGISFKKRPQENLPPYTSNSHTVNTPGWPK